MTELSHAALGKGNGYARESELGPAREGEREWLFRDSKPLGKETKRGDDGMKKLSWMISTKRRGKDREEKDEGEGGNVGKVVKARVVAWPKWRNQVVLF
ncbi:hypothetical protein Droror1_Dr00017729 [Drosera rotundifolia]